MNELEIIKVLARMVDDKEYPFQIPRAFIYPWESDYWALSHKGITKEFEIKISRQDYYKDAHKEKHRNFHKVGPNFFYYVCPEGLITKTEINKKYGLIYIKDGYAVIEKRPQRLNWLEFSDWKLLANKMYWKWRTVWREKYIQEEITFEEFKAGFNLELSEINKSIES